jgi:hypothetical protein
MYAIGTLGHKYSTNFREGGENVRGHRESIIQNPCVVCETGQMLLRYHQ